MLCCICGVMEKTLHCYLQYGFYKPNTAWRTTFPLYERKVERCYATCYLPVWWNSCISLGYKFHASSLKMTNKKDLLSGGAPFYTYQKDLLFSLTWLIKPEVWKDSPSLVNTGVHAEQEEPPQHHSRGAIRRPQSHSCEKTKLLELELQDGAWLLFTNLESGSVSF